MIIPLSVNHPLHKKPIANWIFVGLNVLFFLFAPEPNFNPERLNTFIRQYGLRADDPHLIQFLTHMFMHGGWMHLIGNMVFLYVFGNYANQALGNLHYFIAYIVMGFIAGMGHVILTAGNIPLIGASGAIMGVTGMFLALHGRDKIKIFILFPPFLFNVPAVLVILFWFGSDLFSALHTPPEQVVVAHWVHVFGFVGGFTYSIWLMVGEFIPRSSFDILSFFFTGFPGGNSIVIQTTDTVEPATPKPAMPWDEIGKNISEPAIPAPNLSVQLSHAEPEELIHAIETGIAANDGMAVTVALKTHERNFPMRKFPETLYQQLANFHFSANRVEDAIQMCQRLIRHYPNSPQLAYSYLILGKLYSKSFHEPYHAKNALEKCLFHSHDNELSQQAQALLSSIDKPKQNKVTSIPPLSNTAPPITATDATEQTTSPEPVHTKTTAPSDAASAENLLQELQQAHDAKDGAVACIAFQSLIKQFPDSIPTAGQLQFLANTYYQDQKAEQALAVCSLLINHFPDEENIAHTHYVMGMLYTNFLMRGYEARQSLNLCLNHTTDSSLIERAQALLDKVGQKR